MRKYPALALCLILGLVSACSTRSSLSLSPDGSGSSGFTVSIHPAVMAYLADFALGMGMSGSGLSEFVDEGLLRSKVEEWDGVDFVSLEEADDGKRLAVELRFSDFDAFVDSLAEENGIPGLLRFTDDSRITVQLDPWIIHRIISIAAPEGNAFTDVFGPQPQNPYSESEYREIVDYAFDGYLDEGDTDGMLSTAEIEFSIEIPGEITSVLGGKQVSDDTAEFTIPFLDLVTLSRTIEWTVDYK